MQLLPLDNDIETLITLWRGTSLSQVFTSLGFEYRRLKLIFVNPFISSNLKARTFVLFCTNLGLLFCSLLLLHGGNLVEMYRHHVQSDVSEILDKFKTMPLLDFG